MTIIADKEKTPIAYLHNNTIVVPGSQEVLGVILGDCVYGKNGILKGKFINNTIYTPDGEVLATLAGITQDNTIDISSIRQKSWQVINAISNHISPWITPTSTWARQSFPEVLLS
jgi:hypothetical protein